MKLNLFVWSAPLLALLTLMSAPASAQSRQAAPSTAALPPVTDPPAAPAPAGDECIPDCRKGFVCAKGQCVSACNPPCAANEVCSAASDCVAVAPAPAPRPVFVPMASAQNSDEERINLETEAPGTAVPRKPQIKVFSFVPRLGVQFAGGGAWNYECSGTLCGTGTPSTDYDLSPAVAVSFDFLFKAGDLFRLGPGLMYTHTMDWKNSKTGVHTEMGNITDFDFVAELIPQVGPTVWLIPRFQLGVTAYNASGTADRDEKSAQADCNTSSATIGIAMTGCDSYVSPHIGFNAGLGFGVMFATGSAVRVRFDTLADYFSFGLEDISVTSPGGGGQTSMKTSTSGVRYLLMGGIEI